MIPIRTAVAAVLVSICVSTASAQPASTPSPEAKGQPAPQGYSVVLVLGDMQSASSAADNVPLAARKALTDMKDFLPYKSYRLLDAQWILGSQRATTRLRGHDEQEYELTLRGSPLGGKLNVAFQLHEPGAAESAAGVRAIKMAELDRALQAANVELAKIQERFGEKHPNTQVAAAKVKQLRQEMEGMEMSYARGARAIIDTSFSMDIGETVVVGTSRLRGGDKALIALLTAVPKGSAPKRDDE